MFFIARAVPPTFPGWVGRTNTTRFPDGEFNFQILENVRGSDVFIVQPTSPPVDANVMELLIMIDALKRASAARITAVIPYYAYGRTDKKDQPRVPITARLIADCLSSRCDHAECVRMSMFMVANDSQDANCLSQEIMYRCGRAIKYM